ncbi:MAG: hypothetical protein ABL308_11160 [Oceanicaulis sp.]
MSYLIKSGVLAAALAAGAATAAQAQELLTSVRHADMERLVEAAGYEVVGGDAALPTVQFRTPDGLNATAFGTSCTDGDCTGMNLIAQFDSPPSLDVVNGFSVRYAAISAVRSDGAVYVTRYLILDHGQTFENLTLNFTVFANIAGNYPEYVRTALGADDDGGINFGDDTSTWANDGECDDTRFTGDDEWLGITLNDDHRFKDATDCRSLYEAGRIRLKN